jgi:hypothetical protein
VHFRHEQPIAAACEEVAAAFLDPAFYEALEVMPNLGQPEVLGRTEADGRVDLRVRYAFTGDLPSAARRVLDPSKLTWVVESRVDVGTHHTDFRMLPDHYANRLECHGTYDLVPEGDHATVQRMEGDLIVHYPVVGRLAERGIVLGLKEHMGQEAIAVERWVKERP